MGEKIEFEFVNNTQPVTYWIEDFFGTVIKDEYTTTNDNKKTFTFKEQDEKDKIYLLFAKTNTEEKKLLIGVKQEIEAEEESSIEINECQKCDLEEITEFTLFKLKLRNNLENWLHEGEITSEEIDRFKKDCILQWKTKHKSAFRTASNDTEFNNAAHSILDAMRERELSIAGQQLGTDMSHGTFYSLSDIPQIGWLKDWEKYKV